MTTAKAFVPVQFPEPVPVLLQTTPRLLREANACAEGYRKAPKGAGVGPDEADTPINLLSILESNGLDDFFWAAGHVLPGQEGDRDRALRLMAAEFAASCLHLFEAERPKDTRPRQAIEAARDVALGKDCADALVGAWAAADAAARAAEDAVGGAAWAAAWAAARGDQYAIVRRYLK